MTTSTLTRTQARNVAVFSAADSYFGGPAPTHEFVKGDNGNQVLVLHRVPVFRSGEFADSMGRENLWEEMHMNQMVSNYNLLKDSNTFKDVPIRKGHPSLLGGNILDDVVGYHGPVVAEKLISNHDGKEYTFFLAEMQIIDEGAQEKILNGLWRNVSAEIGTYITNSKAEYWPCYMGVAYVDIPAVEGLSGYVKNHSKATDDFSLLMEEDMTGTTVTPAAQPPVISAPEFSFSLPGEQSNASTTDFAKAQAFMDAQHAKIAERDTKITELTTANTALETFKKETLESARTDFVTALVTGNKILAADQDKTLAFCKGMSAEQFASYKELMGGAPEQAILGQYGHQSTEGAPGTPAVTEASIKSDKIGVLKDIVATHSAAGMPKDKITGCSSYKELIALEPAFAATFQ